MHAQARLQTLTAWLRSVAQNTCLLFALCPVASLSAFSLSKASRPRQCAAAEARAQASGDKVVARIAEVVSGRLPAEQRPKLLVIITSKKFDKIYVIAQASNVQIVPSDMPTLYDHSSDPMHKFLRKIIVAVTELDRDMTVEKLRDGIRRKMKNTVRKTRQGRPKVSGKRTLMEKLNPCQIGCQAREGHFP